MILLDWFQKGGPVMWLLLGCSLAGFALVVERALFWILERRRLDIDQLDAFVEAVHEDKPERARSLAESSEVELLTTLGSAWEREGPQSLMEALDLTINRIEQRCHRYLYGLKTIVAVSPLLGILGTVLGIIQSFNVLGAAGAAANPQAVGAGLAEALVTTAFGLIIAVPGLIAHNYFKARARQYVQKLDDYADELAFHLSPRSSTEENGAGTRPSSDESPTPSTPRVR